MTSPGPEEENNLPASGTSTPVHAAPLDSVPPSVGQVPPPTSGLIPAYEPESEGFWERERVRELDAPVPYMDDVLGQRSAWNAPGRGFYTPEGPDAAPGGPIGAGGASTQSPVLAEHGGQPAATDYARYLESRAEYHDSEASAFEQQLQEAAPQERDWAQHYRDQITYHEEQEQLNRRLHQQHRSQRKHPTLGKEHRKLARRHKAAVEEHQRVAQASRNELRWLENNQDLLQQQREASQHRQQEALQLNAEEQEQAAELARTERRRAEHYRSLARQYQGAPEGQTADTATASPGPEQYRLRTARPMAPESSTTAKHRQHNPPTITSQVGTAGCRHHWRHKHSGLRQRRNHRPDQPFTRCGKPLDVNPGSNRPSRAIAGR